MKIASALAAVFLLIGVAYWGAQVEALKFVFLSILPYAALLAFAFGLLARVISWARSPVPFRIPTTAGQQRSLPSIRPAKIDNPATNIGVVFRMLLEILTFRSLFRNTTAKLDAPRRRLTYASNYSLWFFGLLFHWSLLIVVIRHLRFFLEPVPSLITALQKADGFFQIGLSAWYATSLFLVAALLFLFLRRALSLQLRYISLASDYFPIFLILSVAVTGILLRHFFKTDVVAVKELCLGLLSFHPMSPLPGLNVLFYIHFFLVICLVTYVPLSKISHLAGVFLSPTRNLANNSRKKRQINPWNATVHFRSYEEYEDEFRDKMKAAHIPVDKE